MLNLGNQIFLESFIKKSKKLRHFRQISDEEHWTALIGNALNPVLSYHPAILSEMVTAYRKKLSLNLVQARIILATVL